MQTNLTSYVEVYTDEEDGYDDKCEINPQIITDHCHINVPLHGQWISKNWPTPHSRLVRRVTDPS